ncbi:MAG: hypothetical protein ACK58N_16460 [Synechocystis sp.]|jgi:hypothetical protein
MDNFLFWLIEILKVDQESIIIFFVFLSASILGTYLQLSLIIKEAGYKDVVKIKLLKVLSYKLLILDVGFTAFVVFGIYQIFFLLNQLFEQFFIQVIILFTIVMLIITNYSRSVDELIDELNNYLGGFDLRSIPILTKIFKLVIGLYKLFYDPVYEDIITKCQETEAQSRKETIELLNSQKESEISEILEQYETYPSEELKLKEMCSEIDKRIMAFPCQTKTQNHHREKLRDNYNKLLGSVINDQCVDLPKKIYAAAIFMQEEGLLRK